MTRARKFLNRLPEATTARADVTTWKRDFNKFIKSIRTWGARWGSGVKWKITDFGKLVKEWDGINTSYKKFFQNLRDWLERDLLVRYDPEHKEFIGYEYTEKLRERLREFENGMRECVWYFDPKSRADNMYRNNGFTPLDFYKNPQRLAPDVAKTIEAIFDKDKTNALKNFLEPIDVFYWYFGGWDRFGDGTGIGGKIEDIADKFWDQVKVWIKKLGGGKDTTITTSKIMEFDIAGVRFINKHPGYGVTEEDINYMGKPIAQALKLIRKYLPEVVYSPIYLGDKSKAMDVTNVRAGRTSKAAGTYRAHGDEVTLFVDPPVRGISGQMWAEVLIHELAHRYYFRFMTLNQRERWRKFFDELRTEGVTDYSHNDDAEDFAETMLHYIRGSGVMKSRDARDRLKAIMSGKKYFEGNTMSRAKEFLNRFQEGYRDDWGLELIQKVKEIISKPGDSGDKIEKLASLFFNAKKNRIPYHFIKEAEALLKGWSPEFLKRLGLRIAQIERDQR